MTAFRENKLAFVLGVLLALLAFRYWPLKHSLKEFQQPRRPTDLPGKSAAPTAQGESPARSPGAGSAPGMRQRLEAELDKMTDAQRKGFSERMKADLEFMESLRDLPEDQRREKMAEHFAQNPPPFGADFDGGGPGSGPPPFLPGEGEGPGNGAIHIPPPAIRRSMDQQIANSQKKLGTQ